MTDQLKSQIVGLALAFSTAIGCIAYEKIVKATSYGMIVILSLLFFLPAILYLGLTNLNILSADCIRVWKDHKLMFWDLYTPLRGVHPSFGI